MEQDDAFGTNMGCCEGYVAVRDGAFTKVSIVRPSSAGVANFVPGCSHPLIPFRPTLRGPHIGPSLVFGTTSTCETHTFVLRQP